MSFHYSPRVVRDSSLILYLDSANSRSYAGGSIWKDLAAGSSASITSTDSSSPVYSAEGNGILSFTGSTNNGAYATGRLSGISQDFTFNAWINPSELNREQHILDLYNIQSSVQSTVPNAVTYGLDYNPNNNTFVMCGTGSSNNLNIYYINGGTYSSYTVNSNSSGLVVSHGTNRAYIARLLSNSIEVFSLATFSVIATVNVSPGPIESIGYNSTADRIYISHGDTTTGKLSVIECSTNLATEKRNDLDRVGQIHYDADTDSLFVSAHTIRTLRKLSSTYSTITSLVLPGAAYRMTSDGTHLYVSQGIVNLPTYGPAKISKIRISTMVEESSIIPPSSKTGNSIRYNPVDGNLYFSNGADNFIYVYNTNLSLMNAIDLQATSGPISVSNSGILSVLFYGGNKLTVFNQVGLSNSLLFLTNTNKIGSYNFASSGTLSTSSWYMVTLTKKSDQTAACYINGSLDSTGTIQNLSSSADYFTIGRLYTTGMHLNAKLSSVMVYSRSLSAAEVLQNFNAIKPRFGL